MTRYWITFFAIGAALVSGLGCSDDTGAVADATPADAPDDPDAAPPDARPVDARPPYTGHLLLSEVTLAGDSDEFIEIYNPSVQAVDLTDYYLSDDQEYWLLPAIYSQLDTATQPRPAIHPDFDFVVKFPDGAIIGPGEVRTMAFYYTRFATNYGMPPDFAILEAPDQTVAMVDPSANGVDVVGNDPKLTNGDQVTGQGGESVILFRWDGASDLVTDVDLINAGYQLTGGNKLVSKTGEMVDGPDADGEFSYYRTEALSLTEIDWTANSSQSHKRILLEDGYETQNGAGNGIDGQDELSEAVAFTWDKRDTFSPPSPGMVPESLVP